MDSYNAIEKNIAIEIDNGRLASQKMEWERSLQIWSSLAKVEHSNLEAHYRAGQAAFHLNDLISAESFLKNVLRINSSFAEALRYLGRVYCRKRNWELAKFYWGEFYTLDSEDYEGQFRLGQALVELGQFDLALPPLQLATIQRPSAIEVIELYAIALEGLNQFSEAIKVWQNYSDESDGQKSRALSRLLIKVGTTSSGEINFNQFSVKKFDSNEALDLNLSEIISTNHAEENKQDRKLLYAIKDADSARNWHLALSLSNQLLSIEKDNIEANFFKAKSLYRLGRAYEAIIPIQRAMVESEEYSQAYTLFRLIQRKTSQYSYANLTKENEFISPLVTLAEARELSKKRLWSEALNAWELLLLEDSKIFEPYYRCALSLFHLHRLEESESYVKSSLHLRPDHIDSRILLARITHNLEKWNDAEENWRLIHSHDPKLFEPNYRLAQILSFQNKLFQSKDFFERAIAIRPGHADCLKQYLGVLKKLSLQSDALNIFEGLTKEHGNDLEIILNRAVIMAEVEGVERATKELISTLNLSLVSTQEKCAISHFLVKHSRWSELINLFSSVCDEQLDSADNHQIDLLNDLMIAYEKIGDFDKALFTSDLIIEVSPNHQNSLVVKSRIFRKQSKISDAISIRELLVKIYPNKVEHYSELIFLLGGLDRDDEIPKVLALAHKNLNMSAAELFSLGKGLESALLILEAEKYIIDSSKSDPAYLERLAEFYYRHGRVHKALQTSIHVRQNNLNSISSAKVMFRCLKIFELCKINFDQIGSTNLPDSRVETPQVLFKFLVDSLLEHPRSYEPNPSGVILLTGSLAGGGAEKQLVTTIRGLMKYVRGSQNIALFAQNLSRNLRRDFYLSKITDLPLDIIELDHEMANLFLHNDISFDDAQFINLFPSDMSLSIAFWLSEIIKRKPAVIHAWQDMTCLTAVVAALLAGVPKIILNTRSMRPDNPRKRLKPFMAEAYQSVLRHPSVQMINNSYAGARDYEEWLKIPVGSIQVNHNGIDFETLDLNANQTNANQFKLNLGIPKEAPVIGGVFRLSEVKRPLLWIETAHLVSLSNPSVHFIIAGDGPMYQKILDRARELEISDRVHLLGHVEVASWYLVMDILLLSSRMEGMPNVLLEAQALGIPVVAPKVGGCPETVDQGKTGWIVENADANSLSERIIWILNNPEWIRKAKKRSINYARKEFSIEAMIGRTLKFYKLPVIDFEDLDLIDGSTKSQFSELCREANQFLADQNPSAALEILKKLELTSPPDPLLYRLLARAESRLARHYEAVAYWQKLLELINDDFEATYRLGELLVSIGENSQALLHLKNAVKINESHIGPRRALARIYSKQGLLQLALESWNHLLLLDSSDAEALFASGKILLQIRQNKKGEERLALAASVGKSYQAAELLIKILSFSKRTDEALVIAKTGVIHNPRSLEWHRLLFNLYVTLGVEEKIYAYLKNVKEQDENSILNKLFYAKLLVAAEKFDESKYILLNLRKYPEVRVQSVIALVQIALQTANFSEAEKYYQDLSPEDLKDKSISQDIGKLQQAIGDYQLFVKSFHPQTPLEGSKIDLSELFLNNLNSKIGALPIKSERNTVLHIVNSLAAGGTERQAVETAIAQKKSGLYKQIIVLRADPSDSGRASFFIPLLEKAGVQTQTLSEFLLSNDVNVSTSVDLFDKPSGVIAGYLGLFEIRQYLKAIQQLRPEYLHLWTPQCCIRAGIAGVVSKVPKIILRAGSVSPGDRVGMMPGESTQFPFYKKVYKKLVQQKNVVMINNCKANLNSYAQWMDVNLQEINSGIIHNGIDFSKFGSVDPLQVDAIREELDIPKNATVIGSVIRFEKEKGIDTWLGIAQQLVQKDENIHFVLVGDGRLRNALKDRICEEDLEDNIHLPGMISEGIANYYGLMDIFILTSMYEGLPNALIEAQWFGLPIVSTNVGGVSEAIDPSMNSQLVGVGDIDSFVIAIEKLLVEPKKMKKMGEAGHNYVKKYFSINEMLAQTNKIYHS